jgi:hypothetical protein
MTLTRDIGTSSGRVKNRFEARLRVHLREPVLHGKRGQAPIACLTFWQTFSAVSQEEQ